VNTRNTAGTGSGVLRCAKVQYRTRTRGTRFGSTAGKPVPVRNPIHWSWGLVLCNEIVLKLKYNNVEWWPSIRNFGLSYCYVFTELKL
jgi:hypothetical protein